MPERKKYTEQLEKMFLDHFGEPATKITAIPPSGSDRSYIRMEGAKHKAVAAYSTNKKENNTYFYLTNLFSKDQLSVPEIFDTSSDSTCYLMEDKGRKCLLDLILEQGTTDEVLKLYEKAVSDLVRFQWIAGRDVDFERLNGVKEFDAKAILADLNYFKYYFADLHKVDYDKITLAEELETWAKNLGSEPTKTFMYRDFQGRNILVDGQELGYIDFQGGMKGLPQYDLASLLWQAKAQLPKVWKNHLEKHYLQTVSQEKSIANFDDNRFMRSYLECVLLRILQTLGAYGLRGLIERKPHFISSIKPALLQLKAYLDDYASVLKFPELQNLLEQLVKDEVIERYNLPQQNTDVPLQVKIYSFSYKKGLPKDTTGHGGGFVFDCRGILNPGRFEAYKTQTGRETPVIQFLESKTHMGQFLDGIFSVVDITVKDYLNRGFDALTISFGCTGGQHRSVYAAEQMKKHLKYAFNIDAEILHLEQDPHNHERR